MCDLKVEAWKINESPRRGEKVEDFEFIYRLQVDNLNQKTEGKFLRAVEGWKSAGSFFREENSTFGLIFTRSFATSDEWKEWAKDFPYPLIEIGSRSDKTIKIKTAFSEKKEGKVKRKRGKKTCKNCGQKGHIAKTCKNEKKEAKSKKRKKGQRVCGKCGKVGHNARTCQV